MPTVGSVFSGIGGFDRGLEAAGWTVAWQIENDPFCSRVLARQWRSVRRFGDVRAVTVTPATREQQPDWADLLCGGFPCQDLSVAGKRAGLYRERSSLFFEFVRLAEALAPTWCLLENVPGLLTSHRGRDFAILLATLGERGFPDMAWRTLDSRWFGVPQRRRRVFILARRAGAASPHPREVLFEPESGGGHPPAGGEAGTDIAASLSRSTQHVGFGGGDMNVVIHAHTLRASGHDGSEDGTGRGTPLVAFTERTRADGRNVEWQEDIAYSLNNPGRGGRTQENRIAMASLVRRLTPTECERLQGFPDGWTCLCGVMPYSTAACRCPDSPRYRALGNAVTVPVLTWLGERLLTAMTP